MGTFRSLCARILRDEALEAGLDPGVRARDPGRSRGAAARPHRRAASSPPRDPWQPGAAARELRLPDRPAQARRWSLPDELRVPRGARWRRRRGTGATPSGPRRAGARVRRCVRRSRAAAGRARRARLRRPPAARLPAPAREASRARACDRADRPRAGGRAPGHELRRVHGARRCCARRVVRSPWRATRASRSTASAAAVEKNLQDFREAFPEAGSVRLEESRRMPRAGARGRLRRVLGEEAAPRPRSPRARRCTAGACASGAAPPSAPRRRRWPPRWSS